MVVEMGEIETVAEEMGTDAATAVVGSRNHGGYGRRGAKMSTTWLLTWPYMSLGDIKYWNSWHRLYVHGLHMNKIYDHRNRN